MSEDNRGRNQWMRQLDDTVRGASGGFLFSIPLLYTMEVWWVGTFVNAQRMFVALVITFGIVFLLNRTSGFRKGHGSELAEVMPDTIHAVALSLICTAFVLFLLRRVTMDTPLDEALGKVVYEAVPFALGVALANQFLSSGRQQQSGSSSQKQQQGQEGRLNATLKDIGATIVGAIFIGFTIAPTTEIPMLAADITAPWLLGLMALSLLVSYGIVFESGFAEARKRRQQQGIFQRPLSETVVAYLVSLVVAAAMLWFFHQVELDDSWQMWINYTVVLGLPATVGGAAGRIAV